MNPCARSLLDSLRLLAAENGSNELAQATRWFLAERLLLSNRKIDSGTGCWLWTGPVNSNGYGYPYFPSLDRSVVLRQWGAHRIAAMLWIGDPSGKVVLHRCDVRLCFNPDHLSIGSFADNTLDMVLKGRHRHIGKVLAKSDIQAIRESQESSRELAKRYGVSRTAIQNIRRRVSWRHVA